MNYYKRLAEISVIIIYLVKGVRCEDNKGLIGLIAACILTGLLLMVFIAMVLILPALVSDHKDTRKKKRRGKPPLYTRQDRVRIPVEMTNVHDKHVLTQHEERHSQRSSVPEDYVEREFYFNPGWPNATPYSQATDPHQRVPFDPYSTVIVTELDDDRNSRRSASYSHSGQMYQGTLPRDRPDGMHASATNLSYATGGGMQSHKDHDRSSDRMTEEDEKVRYLHVHVA